MAGMSRNSGLYVPQTYSPNGVVFNGTNTYLDRQSAFSGVSDSASWMAAGTVKWNGGLGSQTVVSSCWTSGNVRRFFFVKLTSDKVQFLVANSSNTEFRLESTITVTTGQWYNILVSTNGTNHYLYIDDVDRTNAVATPVTGAFTEIAKIGIGAHPHNAAQKHDGEIADLWVAWGSHLDLSIAANRRKFFSAEGCLVDKGSDGSKPLAATPTAYFGDHNAASNWHLNNAGTGDMSVNGALSDSAADPCGA